MSIGKSATINGPANVRPDKTACTPFRLPPLVYEAAANFFLKTYFLKRGLNLGNDPPPLLVVASKREEKNTSPLTLHDEDEEEKNNF